jgi:hypothetical protein
MTVLQPGFKWATFRTRVKRVNVALAHYIQNKILGLDFMTKGHCDTASRLDSVIICYGCLTWLGINKLGLPHTSENSSQPPFFPPTPPYIQPYFSE